jgi:type II secretory ATPase GspE/PulE/Tfp pilus assembly ATPase PilB-like protein
MVVAAVDPTKTKTIEELEFMVQGRVITTLGDEMQIQQTIPLAYEKHGLHGGLLNEDLPGFSSQPENQASSSELLESMEQSHVDDTDSAPEKAIEQSDNTLGAPDQHHDQSRRTRAASRTSTSKAQPRKAKVRIRFRKDGAMAPYLELPHTYRQALVARLKIMADLDISERRKPQDGKIDFAKFSPKTKLELRIATIPTSNGLEDVVMRSAGVEQTDSDGKARLDQRQLQPVAGCSESSLWHGVVRGANRLRQNHHAALGAGLPQHTRPQDLDRRRPG